MHCDALHCNIMQIFLNLYIVANNDRVSVTILKLDRMRDMREIELQLEARQKN